MPELAIIIVNWNTGELLEQCVRSIEANSPGVNYEIYVVDNASMDESHLFLRALKRLEGGAPIYLIENQENLGFARANNQAIAISETPLLLLLNPDSEVAPGAIDAMIETIRLDTDIGVCGPRLHTSDGSLQPSVWSTMPGAIYCLLDDLQLYRLLPEKARGELLLGRFWNHDSQREVKSLSGAAMMVKREVIDSVGG